MRTEIFAAVALASLLAASNADAFCRTTTVAVPNDHDPSTGCFTQGVPLYHPSSCLPYMLLTKESPSIPNAVLSDKLARAFAAWTAPNPVCTPGIGPIELAPVADEKIADYQMGQRGHNVVGVPPTWPYTGQSSTLALTTLTFNANTGEVYDADLEVNGTSVVWSFTETPPKDGFDLQSALTHEAGHMLGFSHAPLPDATMYASYTPGSIDLRDLSRDDQNGVCWVYPTRGQRMGAAGLLPATTCTLSTGGGGGANGGCADPAITHGCSIGATPRGDLSFAIGAAALALFAIGRLTRARWPRETDRERTCD